MGGYPMPMYTHGQNFGYSAKAEIPESSRDMLRVGSDLHGFLLNDWWTPVPGTTMMCCNTFWNIHNGERYDLGTFAEWERKWTPQWTTLLGVRNDTVWMNTGDVQGYSTMMYGKDANTFNAEDHARTDVNFDATALARYEADPQTFFEGGYAMKTRSPSLYERYDWSFNGMAALGNGFAGDGNYYVGNINLKPETANTLSVSYGLHDTGSYKDGGNREWELKVTPYYSYVEDYIDVERCAVSGTNGSRCPGGMNYTKNQTTKTLPVELQYVNQNAEIYGADFYGRMPLAYSDEYGKFGLVGVAGFDHGTNLVTGGGLYHMMPLNAKLTLTHNLGNWSSAAELQLVDAKTDVETVRNELQTPGYALVNLRTSYQWGQVRFDLGVENLFDKQYYSPLGGAYLGNALQVNAEAASNAALTPLAGMGRNIYGGITVKF
jgi:iron complex outermembrane receptor protein